MNVWWTIQDIISGRFFERRDPSPYQIERAKRDARTLAKDDPRLKYMIVEWIYLSDWEKFYVTQRWRWLIFRYNVERFINRVLRGKDES